MSSINVDMKEQMTEEFLPQQKTKEGDWDVEDSDENDFPRQAPKIEWQDLNQDFESHAKDHKHVKQIVEQNPEKLLDLRPYMIERPFTVT